MATTIYMNDDGTPAEIIVDGVSLPNVQAAIISFQAGGMTRVEIGFTDTVFTVSKKPKIVLPDLDITTLGQP